MRYDIDRCITIGEQLPVVKKRRMSDESASSVRIAIDLGYDQLMTEKVTFGLLAYYNL